MDAVVAYEQHLVAQKHVKSSRVVGGQTIVMVKVYEEA